MDPPHTGTSSVVQSAHKQTQPGGFLIRARQCVTGYTMTLVGVDSFVTVLQGQILIVHTMIHRCQWHLNSASIVTI